jgi:hypothetical protein
MKRGSQSGSPSMLTYILVGTTAMCALDYPRCFPETSDTFLPTKKYSLQVPGLNNYWNTSNNIETPALNAADPDTNVSVITQFAEKLVSNTVDLDQDIVRALGSNFWDLI